MEYEEIPLKDKEIPDQIQSKSEDAITNTENKDNIELQNINEKENEEIKLKQKSNIQQENLNELLNENVEETNLIKQITLNNIVINKIKVDKDKDLYLLNTNPKHIILSKPLEQFYFESKLEIKNISNTSVVFYIIKEKKLSSLTFIPSINFLIPDETVLINIKRMENVIKIY